MASRLHAEIDLAVIGPLVMAEADRLPEGEARSGTKWFIDSTAPGLTQGDRRLAFTRAVPKNLATVDLDAFLPPEWRGPAGATVG
jgi:hypothetical protein